MKLVEIKDVRVGQIWKDEDDDLWLEWNDRYAPPIRDTKYYRCDKETFKYLVEHGHKLVGFLGITHKIKDFKLVEYEKAEYEIDDICYTMCHYNQLSPHFDVGCDFNDITFLVANIDTTQEGKILLFDENGNEYLGQECEKIGTLGVNYEFVHDRLKNSENFNTSDGNVKGDYR